MLLEFLFSIFLIIILIFIILNFVSKRTNKPTAEDVANLLEKIIQGKITDNELDDFLCCPIGISSLEKIRVFCTELPVKYPPNIRTEFCNSEGLKALSKIVLELKKNVSFEQGFKNKV